MTDQEVPSSSLTQMITPEHQDGQDEGEVTDQEVPSSSSTQMITPEHQDGQDEGEVTVSLMVLFSGLLLP